MLSRFKLPFIKEMAAFFALTNMRSFTKTHKQYASMVKRQFPQLPSNHLAYIGVYINNADI